MDYSKLKGKRLLILAGAYFHTKVVRAAKEMGIYTIVTDYLEDSPAKKIADESLMFSIMDVDEIVDWCKEHPVDGVLNFCNDVGQWPYQKICEKLGLPCHGTKEQFEIMTDKPKFKKYCIEYGVDVIPEYSEEDIAVGSVEYPVFIKPSDSCASRGQSICYNQEEALLAVEKAKSFSRDGQIVCEKYMGGHQDLATAYFVVDGEPYLVKFGDRHLGRKEDNLAGQVMCTRLPSVHAHEFENNSIAKVKSMIKALGIKYGPVFLQGFADGDTIRYYDPALRMPGGDYDLVLKKATGFDTVKSLIYFALTGETKESVGNPKNCYLLNDGIALLICFSFRPGIVKKVVGLDTLLHHQYVVYGRQMIFEGEEVPNTGTVKQRGAAIGAYIPDKSLIKDFIKEVYDTYHVYDDKGEDMIVSKYEYKE